MSHQVLRIALPCNVVAQQVLGLGEIWLEDAVRTAVSAGTPSGEARQGARTAGIGVRIGRPCGGPDALELPMEWELPGAGGAVVVRGELAVVPAGHDEALIGVNMAVSTEASAPRLAERTPLEEIIESATGSFLQRLFWTLQAMGHYKLPAPGADRPSASRSRRVGRLR
jgi:hypothetical protein